MPVKVDPHKIRGPWSDGFALDVHTTSSTIIGHKPFGHPVFDTTRSPLGELLYKLKNRGVETVIPEIVDAAVTFLRGRGWRMDAIVPVPPSNTARKSQPVIAVASALGVVLGIPVCDGCVTKVKSTGHLKDVFDFAKRTEILSTAFSVDIAKTKGQRLLLFDDLYRSGATVSTIAELLMTTGAARAVYLLTLTQTRKLS